MTRTTAAVIAASLSALFGGTAAHAHPIAGPRVLPVTLTIDDPGVADEASLPTLTGQSAVQSPSRRHTMRIIVRTFAVAFLLLPGLAHGHARLRQTEPPAGGTVNVAPTQVDINFSEAVEPRFSTVAVTDAAGATVDKGDLHVVAGDGKHLAVSLGALKPGAYTVTWHATSVDTHKTEGSFTFTVAP